MARFTANFHAKTLCITVNVEVVIPNDVLEENKAGNSNYKRPMKTMILLHGYSGSEKDWINGTEVVALCAKYKIAAVMPYSSNSFYLNNANSEEQYEDFLSKEFIKYMQTTFHLFDNPSDTYIGGVSMGRIWCFAYRTFTSGKVQ